MNHRMEMISRFVNRDVETVRAEKEVLESLKYVHTNSVNRGDPYTHTFLKLLKK